jgi:hypothetical protein
MKPPSKFILALAAIGGLFAASPAGAYDYGYEPRYGYSDGWSSRHHHRSAYGCGCSRSTVAWAQSILNDLGYHCGYVDGILGWRTRQALLRYQCDHDLPHTGYLDHETMCMLRQE